jgi:hypothetical protein
MVSCFTIKYNSKGGSIPLEAKTFSVQYVENQARTVEPGLSQQVTDAFKEYIQKNTNLIMVSGTGDIDIEAVISEYDPNKPVSVVAGDLAAKNRFTLALKVKFTCDVNPDLDFESSFSRYRDFSSESNFESVKTELTDEMLEELMEDVYKKAFVNW